MSEAPMLEVKGEDYQVWYEPEANQINCKGSLRLGGTEEYAPIASLMEAGIANPPVDLIINLTELDFLNSSGINMLSKFVIKARQKPGVKLTIKGSEAIPWQGKSLKNLQRLMPNLVLEIS